MVGVGSGEGLPMSTFLLGGGGTVLKLDHEIIANSVSTWKIIG